MPAAAQRWRLVALVGVAFSAFVLLDVGFGGPVTTRVPELSSRLPSYDELASGFVGRLPSFDWSWSGGDGIEEADELVTPAEIDAAYAADEPSTDSAADDEGDEVLADFDSPTGLADVVGNVTACSPQDYDAGRWVRRSEPRPAPTCRWYHELREAPRRASSAHRTH